MKPEFSRQFLEKYSNIKFHKNPSNRSGDITKLTVAFRNSGNAPKKAWNEYPTTCHCISQHIKPLVQY